MYFFLIGRFVGSDNIALDVINLIFYIYVDSSKISMYYSSRLTLEFLLMKRSDEIMSTDSLARKSELYIIAREKSLSFSAWRGGIEK